MLAWLWYATLPAVSGTFLTTPRVASFRKDGPYRYYLLKSNSIQGPYRATTNELYDTELNSTDWRLEGHGRTVWRWDDVAVMYLPE